jgi:hypothetical protein
MMSIRFGLEDFHCSHTFHSYRVEITERPKLGRSRTNSHLMELNIQGINIELVKARTKSLFKVVSNKDRNRPC